jgi:hypothetical protein
MVLCDLWSVWYLERENSESQVEVDDSRRAAVKASEAYAMMVR